MSGQDSSAHPDWLSKEFFEKSLRKGLNQKEVKVLRFEIEKATSTGDNYASQLYRCKLTIATPDSDENERKMSIIVKVIPSGIMGEKLREFSVFERETEALTNTLPAVYKILKRGFPDEEKFWPECYYYQDSPNNLLVMEDLKVKRFALANRFEGLDMDHIVLVLRSVAKLHAASLIWKEGISDEKLSFYKSIWQKENSESIEHFFRSPFSILAKMVLAWEDVEKRGIYSEKFKYIKDNVIDMICKTFEMNRSKLCVYNHGDCWVNNFMFRYDADGKPDRVTFIDFQISSINSPALDLQYFIFTSTNPELRFRHIDTFLRVYHEAFEETLRRLNHVPREPYGFGQLVKDFEEKYIWGFIVSCTIYPHFLLSSEEAFQSDEFFNAEIDRFQLIFQKEKVKNILKKTFAFFDEKGVL